MTKIIISLSGGLDSATLLGLAVGRGYDVQTVGFFYNAKHNHHENQAALNLSRHYNVPYRLLDLSSLMVGFRSNLMQGGGDIPEGHYEAESMTLTVVPARNIIFASILTGVAWSEGATEVWLGIHAGDRVVYPDCRPQFFEAMRSAVELGSDHRVTLTAPFLYIDKGEILRKGLEIGVPYVKTRTCYTTNPAACGRCGSCNERREAFQKNGVEDPIEYEYNGPLPTKE